jgi:Uma2 family endonuclease
MTIEDWNRAIGREGSTYKLIDGRLCVHPFPEAPHEALQHWLQLALMAYEDAYPEIIQRLTVRAQVYLINRNGPTILNPDLAVYLDPGADVSDRHRSWAEIGPAIVGEVLEPPNISSELDLKVEIYMQFAAIREYWMVDP